MAATRSASASSLVPSDITSGRAIPPMPPSSTEMIVEVSDSQVEAVESPIAPAMPEKVPLDPQDPPNASQPVMNYYQRMALEEDAKAAAAAAAESEAVAGGAESEKQRDKEHHILDEFQDKILKREEQDKLYAEKGGKGRGRGKGKGKGRGGKGKGKGKGKGRGTPKTSSPAPKRKTRRGKKDPTARVLFESDDDTWQDGTTQPKGLKRPAAAKAKAQVKPKSKARGQRSQKEQELGDSQPKTKRTRSNPKKEVAPVETKPDIPVFSKCTLIPYWSRVACGLKVPSTDEKEGEPKKGLRQVFYIGVKGASMKEHIDIIVEIVPGYFNDSTMNAFPTPCLFPQLKRFKH